MISATTVNNSMPSVTLSNTVSGHDKLYVPVRPANVIYTQFDHVSGVAAKPNQAGVTVSKVQILNSLIDQLVSMKVNPKVEIKNGEMIDAKQLDVLIDSFQAKLQSTIQSAEATGYGLAGATPDVGVLFTIEV